MPHHLQIEKEKISVKAMMGSIETRNIRSNIQFQRVHDTFGLWKQFSLPSSKGRISDKNDKKLPNLLGKNWDWLGICKTNSLL